MSTSEKIGLRKHIYLDDYRIYQSIESKEGQVHNIIDNMNQDVIFSTETSVDTKIINSQLCPL